MSNQELVITFAETDEQKAEVAGFINREYLQLFRTLPPASDIYTVAWWEGQIVGCIGLEFGRAEEVLLIEKIYQLRRDAMPLPLSSVNSIQYGRWLVRLSSASALIIYCATRKAIERGRQYGLVEHNLIVHRAARMLGIKFWELPEAALDLAAVAPERREHYARAGMKPYLVDLHQILEALAARIQRTE